MKKTLKTILCLALVLCLFAGCTVVNVAKVGEVNGKEIPLGVYKYAMRLAEMYFGVMDYEDALTMAAMYDSYTGSLVYNAISDIMAQAGAAEEGKSIWDKAYGETTVGNAVKEAVFDELAMAYASFDVAAEKEITLTEEELTTIKNTKNNLYDVLGSKTSFDNAIGKINLNVNQLTDLWTMIAYSNKLTESIAEENEVADEDIQAYFNENYMRVKHILVKVGDEGIETMEDAKAKTEEIISAIDSGADFEGMMIAYSSDVDSEGNINGGEEGYIFKEGDFGNPAFEDASLALASGEYTKEPVEVNGGSYQGYHIIKKYDIPENYYADNQEELSKAIEATLDSEAFEAYMETAMAEADVVKNESKIKGVKLTVIE